MKNNYGEVSIVNIVSDSVEVAAAAGRISTTYGSANEVLSKSRNNSNNLNLISKVLDSGHKSIIEHISFNLSFNNVSVFVEQFIIEFRLASYTVQSRRYVDFSDVGFCIPDNLSEEAEVLYTQNMQRLFDDYKKLIQLGIPKEDARFVLPYCFRSNFYCTCNARELMHIIGSMLYGRGSIYRELVVLGESLKQQFEIVLPGVIEKERHKYENIKSSLIKTDLTKVSFPSIAVADVQLLSSNKIELDEIASLSSGLTEKVNVDELLWTTRGRCLELLSYVFKIKSISMAALTHLTRHRIQTLIIPDMINALLTNTYVLPKTISLNSEAMLIYSNAFKSNYLCVKELIELNIEESQLIYFVLSGNTIDVISKMNARELLQYINLRTCNRAQWEIRMIALKMLNLVRKDNFDLFRHFGPSCFISGKCPEGRMACGKIHEVKVCFERVQVDEEK